MRMFGAASPILKSGLEVREMTEILFLVLDCNPPLFHSLNTLDDFGWPGYRNLWAKASRITMVEYPILRRVFLIEDQKFWFSFFGFAECRLIVFCGR